MKKGQVFFTSSGEYSDYNVGGHYLALETFSMDKQAKDWMEAHHDRYDHAGPHDFLQHLIAKGLIKEQGDFLEVHLGYGYSSMSGYDRINDAEDDVHA